MLVFTFSSIKRWPIIFIKIVWLCYIKLLSEKLNNFDPWSEIGIEVNDARRLRYDLIKNISSKHKIW